MFIYEADCAARRDPSFYRSHASRAGIEPPLRGDFSLSRTLLGLASASVPDTCGLKAVLSNFPLKREGFRPINSFSIRSG